VYTIAGLFDTWLLCHHVLPLLKLNQKYCALIAVGAEPLLDSSARPVPVRSTASVSPAKIFLISLSTNTGTGRTWPARAAASSRAVLREREKCNQTVVVELGGNV
jgi:hypothetical protein